MKTLTIDIDGVICGGVYLPEWDRKPAIYSELPPIEGACNAVWHLANRYNIYYLTSRCFDSAPMITVKWLQQHLFPLGGACGGGIITGISSAEKQFVSRGLGASLHIDDNPAIVTSMIGTNVKGVLFVGREEAGWWQGTREWIDSGRPYFDDWTTMAKWVERTFNL